MNARDLGKKTGEYFYSPVAPSLGGFGFLA